MVTVEFLGPIDKAPMEVDVKSLSELKAVLSADDDLAKWLANSAIAVNDEMVLDISHPIKSGDKIVILPPVCGG